MCGITGIYSFTGAPTGGALPSMLDTIHHRGPDERGMLIEGPVAMGMTRLSIIDLAGGSQPMANESGSVSVIFNGEIYNYRELAQSLRQRGHVLRTGSDTEVIAHLYEEHGAECVDHLRGMFTFALWDRANERLLLARDRLGIKPLYYCLRPDVLIFASEIKAILRHPEVRPALDHQALGLYLSLKYAPAPHTMFAGISSLPPGHVLTVDRAGVRTTRYWDLEFSDRPSEGSASAEQDAADRLMALLEESIDLHLRADVPFGAFLSGGIDSSLIVALMSRRLSEPVRTYALGFEEVGGEASELPYARTVAKALDTQHSEVLIGPKEFIQDAHDVIWHMDQPIADQATVATYRLAQAASRDVKMVLTGEGGDELFAGYARYRGERYSPLFGALPGPFRRGIWEAASRLPGQRRSKIALYALTQREEGRRFANWFPLFNDRSLAPVLHKDLRAEIAADGAAELFDRHLSQAGASEPVQRMLYVDSKTWLPDFLLLRGDKLTMAHSIEARVPLLDHVVAEFAASRPASEKIRGGTGKYLLKQVARQLLPAEIVNRPKQGFPVPIAQWFRAEARDFINDLLAPSTLRSRGLFDEVEVGRLMSEHQRGYADHAALLWGLASVEIWQRAFLDGHSAAFGASDARVMLPTGLQSKSSSSRTEVN